MTRALLIGATVLTALISGQPTRAADKSGFDELVRVMDSAKVLQASVFAPKTWAKVEKEHKDAKKSIDLQKAQRTIDKYVNKAREYAENALKATEVCRLSLAEYLDPRDRAREARAYALAPTLYVKAENQFKKATAKVESGDVKGALKDADKSIPLFQVAELEAIKEDVVGPANRLIEKALADDASKFALSTLDKAKTARDKSIGILTADRYNHDAAMVEAKRAEFEARHASNIGLSVRSLNRNDQAWEKLMLVYEIQMSRVGEALGMVQLPFDDGALASADSMIVEIRQLQAKNDELDSSINGLRTGLAEKLSGTLSRLGTDAPGDDPMELAQAIDDQVSGMLVEKSDLTYELEQDRSRLAELADEHSQVSEELSSRKADEDRFRKAKSSLNPSEGEVLFNAANDVVLRLSGLSFDVGKSDIKDEHIPLLEKVKHLIEMYPEAQLVVEGHTDSQGDPKSNVTLSEKRAYAVMQYFRQSLLISADRIQAIGYGADKPIASNQTPDGRAKNRRIDILIMQ